MTRSVLWVTVALLMVACEDAAGPNNTLPSLSAAGAIAASSFSTDAVFSGNLVTIENPIAYTVDFGRGFSSISRVTYLFTFGNDPLDPNECLHFFPSDGVGGFGVCNPGTTAQTSRTLTFPCTMHPAECDHFRDGVSGGEFRVDSRLIGNPVSVSLRSVTITIDGVASFTFLSNTWTIRALMPENVWRYGLAAGVVNNAAGQSTVYVLGGRFNQVPMDPPATTILAYDVTTDRWTTKAAHFTGAATNGAGTIGGKVYISGGAEFTGGEWKPVSSKLLAYDVAADRVIRKADMPAATAEGVTGVINGKLYVLAGRCFQMELCSNFYRYDPATNAWTTLPPAPSFHRHGAGVVFAGKFYVAGGGSSPFRSFDVYDPATNTWTTPGLLPPRRQFAVGATAEGKVYVIGIAGGDRDGNEFADRNTVAYSPRTNSWRNKTPYPGPHDGGQFLLHPAAAVRVLLDGRAHILAVGSGHLYSDGTIKPAGTIDPAPPYIYTP